VFVFYFYVKLTVTVLFHSNWLDSDWVEFYCVVWWIYCHASWSYSTDLRWCCRQDAVYQGLCYTHDYTDIATLSVISW